MYCPKCGTENPNDAQVCRSCGSMLSVAAKTTETPVPRMSGLAIAAFVLGMLSIFTLGLTTIPAIICGIISIVLIEKSGGKLTGLAFAVLGIVVSVLVFFVLFILLFSARAPVRSTAYRMVCGTNLARLGKAMLIYSNDYDDELPHAGGKTSKWSNRIADWKADDRYEAYGLETDGTGGAASITSCFYLLVKYAEAEPKYFVCDKDSGTTEFRPEKVGVRGRELIEFWDFGPEPWKHCSYSYHLPYSPYALTTSSEPGMAVAADRNPWIGGPAAGPKDFGRFNPDAGREFVKAGNSAAHNDDGQNVLFLDGHVTFERESFCGINDDNIYTYWDGGDIRRGSTPNLASQPQDPRDSLLVNDPPDRD